MDTMQLGLIFNEDIEFTRRKQKEFQRKVETIESPTGNMFCDVLKFSAESNKIIIKVSYPRYFFSNNAYLIESSKECLQVQKTLVKELEKVFDDQLEYIYVERIDIPFTYLMSKENKFTDYNNIYKIAALVFGRKYKKSISKSIIDTITEDRETIIYSDSKTISAYNKKVMIYNQYLNLETKLDEEGKEFERTIRVYPKLERRMRIEVSSRIKRNNFSLDKFRTYDFFKEYSDKYRDFLLENIFNLDSLKGIYDVQAYVLSDKLEKYRDKKGNKFKYETFIMKELKNIYDYKILKEAIRKNLDNKKSIENAVTQVRKILKELEEEEGLKVLEVKKEIKKIRKTIETSFRKRKTKDEEFPF